MSRRQAELEGELAAAQQVQQILVPEQAETVPGFTVESIYQPAHRSAETSFRYCLIAGAACSWWWATLPAKACPRP